MLQKRLPFLENMKSVIVFLSRSHGFGRLLSDDVIQMILAYVPGKDGTLTLSEFERKILKSDIQYEFDAVHLERNSSLCVNGWDPLRKRGGRLIIHCFGVFRIEETAFVDVSQCGCHGGRQSMSDGESPCNGGGGGGIASGGGSYGSNGEDGIHATCTPSERGFAGTCYGDAAITELYLGSGGGSSFWGGGGRGGGGRGGGAFLLHTNDFENHGQILCNGGNAEQRACGGGSGGSIILDILRDILHTQALEKLGTIQAKGGHGKRLKPFEKAVRGGHGGDGRICINNRAYIYFRHLSDPVSGRWLTQQIKPEPHRMWLSRPMNNGNRYTYEQWQKIKKQRKQRQINSLLIK